MLDRPFKSFQFRIFNQFKIQLQKTLKLIELPRTSNYLLDLKLFLTNCSRLITRFSPPEHSTMRYRGLHVLPVQAKGRTPATEGDHIQNAKGLVSFALFFFGSRIGWFLGFYPNLGISLMSLKVLFPKNSESDIFDDASSTLQGKLEFLTRKLSASYFSIQTSVFLNKHGPLKTSFFQKKSTHSEESPASGCCNWLSN